MAHQKLRRSRLPRRIHTQRAPIKRQVVRLSTRIRRVNLFLLDFSSCCEAAIGKSSDFPRLR